MAIETAFDNLQRQLERLKEELSELRVNAEDFYPVTRAGRRKNGRQTQDAPPPVVALADKATDLEGDVQEALVAVRRATKAVRHPRDLTQAQAELITTHRALNNALQRFLVEVTDHQYLKILDEMCRELGESWPKWNTLIGSVITDCRGRALEAFLALAECWSELAEKLAVNSVSVQATNIGQQITTPQAQEGTLHEVT